METSSFLNLIQVGSWYLLVLWGLLGRKGESASAGLEANTCVGVHRPQCAEGASWDTQGQEGWLLAHQHSRWDGQGLQGHQAACLKEHPHAPVHAAFVLHSISGSTQRSHTKPWTFPAVDHTQEFSSLLSCLSQPRERECLSTHCLLRICGGT